MITFPPDFASSTLSIATTIASSFTPYLELVVGVLIAVIAITFIIRALHK